MKKVLSLLLLLPFCFGGCGYESGAPAGARTPETFEEFAEVFSRYGIQGASPQLTQALEQSFSDLPPEVSLSKGAALLTALGEGGYDNDAMAWAPLQNGVYAFDMEASDAGGMYARFLAGVSALAPEELAFEDIREDTSGVDWESGTGKRTVTFAWQGEEFTLEAEMQHDWFDLRVANQLNKILQTHGKAKQLFFTGDGYQECIVFYRDKEWADAFGAETGLELVESF